MMTWRDHFYSSSCGRLELYARDYLGDGPVLLLMHGLTRNSADFEPLVPHLAGRYRLIVPDQRGRGRSAPDPDPANYRVDLYAADMACLLDGLGIARAGLIGTSMGGLMGMLMAAGDPQRYPALVLNDIGPQLDPAGLARIAGYVGPGEPFADWQAAAHAIAATNGAAFPTFAEADWLAFARRTCQALPDGRVAFAYDGAIAKGFEQADGIVPPDLWPLWAALDSLPVLLLRGTLSDLLPRGVALAMQEHHGGPFRWVEIADRGHAPLLDEPEALNAILPFLAEHVG